ncbi:MAG: hypothetical protein HZC12_05905 [Nitrospirae bacterium]|nr:hypothetical protein [Nitrospirota bacterium]
MSRKLEMLKKLQDVDAFYELDIKELRALMLLIGCADNTEGENIVDIAFLKRLRQIEIDLLYKLLASLKEKGFLEFHCDSKNIFYRLKIPSI